LATFAGLASYQQAGAGWVGLLDVIAETGRLQNGARMELFQGDKARGYLAGVALYEARYQQKQQARDQN